MRDQAELRGLPRLLGESNSFDLAIEDFSLRPNARKFYGFSQTKEGILRDHMSHAQFEIEAAKQRAVSNMEMFLRNFSYVPDDKLHWTPTPTAKSALRVAAHTALYGSRFAEMIRTRQVPAVDNLAEWLAQRVAEEVAVTTREEMVAAFRSSTAEVLEALDGLSPEDLEIDIDSGQGWSMPMRQLINLPGWHATLHLGQIDYLQTCWGDEEVYVG